MNKNFILPMLLIFNALLVDSFVFSMNRREFGATSYFNRNTNLNHNRNQPPPINTQKKKNEKAYAKGKSLQVTGIKFILAGYVCAAISFCACLYRETYLPTFSFPINTIANIGYATYEILTSQGQDSFTRGIFKKDID